MRNIAYRRVSTSDKDQSTERQLFGLDIEFDLEFEDHATGTSVKKRPELIKCLAELKEGDNFVCHSIDRLCRNTKELLEIVQDLVDRKVTVKFMKEHLTLGGDSSGITKAMDGMILSTLGGVHTFQAVMIQESVREGMRVAKANGKLIGGSNPKWKSTFQKNKLLGKHKTPSSSVTATKRNTPIAEEISKMVSYSRDTLTYSDIAEKLNSQGYTTSRGKLFGKVAVKRLIDKFEIPYVQKNRKSVNA